MDQIGGQTEKEVGSIRVFAGPTTHVNQSEMHAGDPFFFFPLSNWLVKLFFLSFGI